MADLMHDDVVEHFDGRENEPPVEGQVAVRRARSPARALVADLDLAGLDAERFGLILDEHPDKLACGAPTLELGDSARVEPQARALPRALGCEPVPVVVQHTVDLRIRHPRRHGEARGRAPRQVDRPSARAPRPAHHHELVQSNRGYWCLRMTTQALCPPNPNELLIAMLTSALRATLGT